MIMASRPSMWRTQYTNRASMWTASIWLDDPAGRPTGITRFLAFVEKRKSFVRMLTLPYSNWRWATVCLTESIAALPRGAPAASHPFDPRANLFTMGDAAERRMTVDEYLAFEETAKERHEFLDGRVWDMSGGTYAHDLLSTAIAAELRAVLHGKPCSAAGPNLRLKSLETGLYTYADALVACDPRFEDKKRTTLLNPRVVVEVLSESSEGYDRGDKFLHYRSIESVQDYVLVSTTARRVEVYTHGANVWELRIYGEGDTIHLPSLDARLAVDTVYRGVELDPPYAHARP